MVWYYTHDGENNVNKYMSPTFRLFAMPSVLEGIGSVMDLTGNCHHYNENKSPSEADSAALKADWEAVGGDLQQALESLQTEANTLG